MPVLAIEDARVESCDLQLGDTWRGKQGKMSLTAPVMKIRKKSDNKPTQIKKCDNEKRRRELENETINQLEELLGTSLVDLKQPDKNGVVREATRQIQAVLKRRSECPAECPLRVAQCLASPEQGEVSPTQQPCAGLHYSEVTSLIEALKIYTGKLDLVLLEINSKAEVVCATENIKDLILQDRTELYEKSIYSIVHAKDHYKLRPLLRNLQITTWGTQEIATFHSLRAHLLIKDSNGTDSAGSVECVIHAAPLRSSSSEEAGPVMCVIRRCDDASAALLPGDGGPPAITTKHSGNIVFRLDSNFNILSCDVSGQESFVNPHIPLADTRYLELIEESDRDRVIAHLKEVACHPEPAVISEPFWLRFAPDRPFVRVIARSRLFKGQSSSTDPDFIMSAHRVLGDDDMDLVETESPCPPVGGPLMTSVANGESSTCESRYRSPMTPSEQSAFSINDFDLDTWGRALLGSDITGEDIKERKNNMAEGHSQPSTPRAPTTPRAPSTPGEGPPPNQPPEEPNRLRSLLSKKPMPGNDVSVNSNNRILKDLLKQEDEEATGNEISAPHTPQTPHTPHTPAAALSPLHSAPTHPRPPPHPPHGSHHSMQQQPHHNSDVLLRILNDKSDEDSEENRRNSGENNRGSQPSALLSQLLSSSNGPSNNGRAHDITDTYIDNRFGVKRKMEDGKMVASNAKRATPENQQQVSSSASSASSPSSSMVTSPASSSGASLSQRNQILVSLLARQQTTPTTPLPLPNPTLRPSQYPPNARPRHPPPPNMPHSRNHSTLSNILLTGVNHRASNVNGGVNAASPTAGGECTQSHLQMVLQSGALQGGARYPPTSAASPHPHTPTSLHYANTAPFNAYSHQPISGSTRSQGSGSNDCEVPADQALSDLLDAVIENMPDAERPPPDVNVRPRQNEKNAVINAIRQSLMQCETVTKAPVVTSPGTPPVYPVQSPVSQQGSCGPSGTGGALYDETARALVLAQQHNRLLQRQRTQQMLVSPEAAEQPQADLGSTINALVSGTPPNVALTRTDYHHLYHHQTNQIGANYCTNKINTTQQNPMLSRQLSVPGGGTYAHGSHTSHAAHGAAAQAAGAAALTAAARTAGGAAHSAASLHTPMTAQPYHRQPRPHLVGGYFEEGGVGAGAAYCDYARCTPLPSHAPHPPHPPHAAHAHQLACAGSGGAGAGAGGTSQYMLNKLRAVVGARSARPELHPMQSPEIDPLNPLMTFDMPASEYYGGGVGGGGGR